MEILKKWGPRAVPEAGPVIAGVGLAYEGYEAYHGTFSKNRSGYIRRTRGKGALSRGELRRGKIRLRSTARSRARPRAVYAKSTTRTRMPRRMSARWRRGRARYVRKWYGKRRGRPRYRRPRGRYRSRRKPVRLRVHPLGFPKTHTIKMRLLAQTHAVTVDGGWGAIIARPADCYDPMRHQGAQTSLATAFTGGSGNHNKLAWYDKTHTGITELSMQPYGWDQWALTPYTDFMVLGSKTTITMAKGAFSDTGDNFIAGWTGLFPETDWVTSVEYPVRFVVRNTAGNTVFCTLEELITLFETYDNSTL